MISRNLRLQTKYFVITSELAAPLSIIFAVGVLIYLLICSPVFRVNTIECLWDFEPCSDPSLLTEIDKYRGQNIFLFEKDVLKNRILSAEPIIRDVEISRQLPNVVQINLLSVFPVLAVKTPQSNTYVALDQQLRVISFLKQNPNVATLLVQSLPDLQIGKVVNEQLAPTLLLTRQVGLSFPQVKELKQLDADTISFPTPGGLTAIFSTQIDAERQINLLQAILRDTTITAGKTQIDLRFTQPILR